MKINKNGKILTGIIVALFVIMTSIAATIPSPDALSFTIRLFALWGLFFLLIASIMTPFLKQLYKAFGVPFLKIHHILAAGGVLFATLHPVNFAIQKASAAVFIPDVSSWISFWELAGRPAIYLIYIATFAAMFRKKLSSSWRKLHVLMYAVLIFLIVHGNLIGTDFQNLGISIIFNGLFAISMVAMIYKQYQKYQRKRKN